MGGQEAAAKGSGQRREDTAGGLTDRFQVPDDRLQGGETMTLRRTFLALATVVAALGASAIDDASAGDIDARLDAGDIESRIQERIAEEFDFDW
jgi:hypothetical protein